MKWVCSEASPSIFLQVDVTTSKTGGRQLQGVNLELFKGVEAVITCFSLPQNSKGKRAAGKSPAH